MSTASTNAKTLSPFGLSPAGSRSAQESNSESRKKREKAKRPQKIKEPKKVKYQGYEVWDDEIEDEVLEVFEHWTSLRGVDRGTREPVLLQLRAEQPDHTEAGRYPHAMLLRRSFPERPLTLGAFHDGLPEHLLASLPDVLALDRLLEEFSGDGVSEAALIRTTATCREWLFYTHDTARWRRGLQERLGAHPGSFTLEELHDPEWVLWYDAELACERG